MMRRSAVAVVLIALGASCAAPSVETPTTTTRQPLTTLSTAVPTTAREVTMIAQTPGTQQDQGPRLQPDTTYRVSLNDLVFELTPPIPHWEVIGNRGATGIHLQQSVTSFLQGLGKFLVQQTCIAQEFSGILVGVVEEVM